MVNVNTTVAVLGQAPLFRGLKKRQLERLAQRFIERTYEADTAIVTQGKGGEGFFVIMEGGAKVLRTRSDGSQVIVNTFGAQDYFGELALLDDGPRTASVITTEPTTCLVLTRWDFVAALKEDGETAVAILQEVAKRFRIALDAL